MKPEIFAQRLVDLNIGVLGTDIFIHSMPASCNVGVLVRMPLTGVDINHELPDYFHDDMQIIVRHTATAAGDVLAKQVQEALTLYNVTLTDGVTTIFVNHMLPATLPIIYRRSDGNLIEWSMNFSCNCVMRPS